MLTASEARAMARANTPDAIRPWLETVEAAIRKVALAGGTSCDLDDALAGARPPEYRQEEQVKDALRAAGYRLDVHEVLTQTEVLREKRKSRWTMIRWDG